MRVKTQLTIPFWDAQDNQQYTKIRTIARVATGAFGFLIFSHAFAGPDLCGASSFFDTMPSRPRLLIRELSGECRDCA